MYDLSLMVRKGKGEGVWTPLQLSNPSPPPHNAQCHPMTDMIYLSRQGCSLVQRKPKLRYFIRSITYVPFRVHLSGPYNLPQSNKGNMCGMLE